MVNKEYIRSRTWLLMLFYAVFYTVGIIGLIVPYSFPYFVRLTLLALILSIIGLFINHQSTKLKQDILIFAFIFFISFIIEAIGVNTGRIFGNYQYGEALGMKLYNTPVIIGLNWLFLTYTGVSISEKLSGKIPVQLIIAPTIMLVYDLVLEQVAPKMDMWSWSDSSVPLENYIAWWLIGFVFTSIFKVFKINTQNPIALFLFLCQFLFFTVLLIFHRLF